MNRWGRTRRWVYAYRVADYRTVEHVVRCGYVGKTSSDPLLYRDPQHRGNKIWAKAIVGPIDIIWEGECGRLALWAREIYWIWRLRPMFNVEWNRHNPDRIPPWTAARLYSQPAYTYYRPRVDVRRTR